MSATRIVAALAAAFTLAASPAALQLEEIPVQRLEPGQCTLFLWTRDSPPRRVFMALQAPAIARVRVAGRVVDLPRVGWEGAAVFGHPAVQRYAGDGLELTVRIETDGRSGLVGGAVAPRATIEYRAEGGWETVVPAAGIVGCQS